MRFECKSGGNRAGAQSAPACSGRYGKSCKAIDISARPNAARCAGAMPAFGALWLETLSPTKRSTNPDANGFAANCPAPSDHFSSAIRWESQGRAVLDTTDCEIASCLAGFTMLPVRIAASRTFNCSLCQLLTVSPVSYECIFRFLLLRWICHANLCIQYLFLWNWADSRALPRRQVGA
jgi:hypothetical protein